MTHALDHLSNYPRISFLKQWGMYNCKLLSIFGSDLKFWVSASFSDQYVQSTGPGGTPVTDGAPVGWIEELVSGYHLSQAITANKSTYRAAHASFGGRSAWDFDGGDYYQRSFGVTYSQPNTILAIAKVSNTTTKIFCDGDDNTHRQVVGIYTGNQWLLYAQTALITAAIVDTNPHILYWSFNTVSSKIYVDGGAAKITGAGGAHNMDGVTLGADYLPSFFWIGQIAELAIINSIPTSAQLNAVGQEWAKYYGISYTPV